MKTSHLSNVALLIVAGTLAMSAAQPAHGQSPPNIGMVVNTVADLIDHDVTDGICRTSANTCSLRAAIMQANHLGTPGLTVTIDLPSGTFTLTRLVSGVNGEDSGDLNLTAPTNANQLIVIRGTSAASTIIDANQIDRVLRISPQRTAVVHAVTIRNGRTTGTPNFVGGCIFNSGILTLTSSVIEGCMGNYGGGIANTGALTVVASTLRSNVATQSGGGLYVEGQVIVRNSTFHGNTAHVSGGGVAVPAIGLHFYAVNSTISANVAYLNGGGVHNQSTTFLYNTSVIGNDADHDQDLQGGIGGGVYNVPGSRLAVVNTLIADNTLGNVPVFNDCAGTLEAYGWNLLHDMSGCSIPNGAAWGFILANSFGILKDNGGPTWTHALLPGSRAIDTTDNDLGCIDETGALLATDQRGAVRVFGPRCDVGAFEYGAFIDRVFMNGFD